MFTRMCAMLHAPEDSTSCGSARTRDSHHRNASSGFQLSCTLLTSPVVDWLGGQQRSTQGVKSGFLSGVQGRACAVSTAITPELAGATRPSLVPLWVPFVSRATISGTPPNCGPSFFRAHCCTTERTNTVPFLSLVKGPCNLSQPCISLSIKVLRTLVLHFETCQRLVFKLAGCPAVLSFTSQVPHAFFIHSLTPLHLQFYINTNASRLRHRTSSPAKKVYSTIS